jgi:hypothetical protein
MRKSLEAQSPRGLQIDRQTELGRLLNRRIGRLLGLLVNGPSAWIAQPAGDFAPNLCYFEASPVRRAENGKA